MMPAIVCLFVSTMSLSVWGAWLTRELVRVRKSHLLGLQALMHLSKAAKAGLETDELLQRQIENIDARTRANPLAPLAKAPSAAN